MSLPSQVDGSYFGPPGHRNRVLYLNLAGNLALQTLLHPLDYVATLLDLGYEPFTPTAVGELIKIESIQNVQSQKHILPPIFDYVKYIYSVDGFFGLYRGLLPRLCCNSILFLVTNSYYRMVSSRFSDLLRQHRFEVRVNRLAGDLMNNNLDDDELADIAGVGQQGGNQQQQILNAAANQNVAQDPNDEDDGAWIYGIRTFLEVISLYCGVVVSHPFHVIAIRSYAQFVGRETAYNSIFGSIAEVYRNEGIFGFFAGLSDRISAHCLYFIYVAAYTFVIRKLFNDNLRTPASNNVGAVLTLALTDQFVGYFGAGRRMDVANREIVRGTGLRIGSPPYSDYKQFWQSWAFYNFEPRTYSGPWVLSNGVLKPSYPFGPMHPAGLGLGGPGLKLKMT